MKPATFGALVSATLYEKRFGPYFVSPVIAGLDPEGDAPYLCGMDSIGAIETAHDFMVAGTAPDSLYGMCESMWRPDMVRESDEGVACVPSPPPAPPFLAAPFPSPILSSPSLSLSLSLSLSFHSQDAEALFETVSQCLLSGIDRDALAGWGAVVYVITPAGCTARTLKGRMD